MTNDSGTPSRTRTYDHRLRRPTVNAADTDGCDPETKGEPKWPLPHVSIDGDGATSLEWIVGTQGGGWQRRFSVWTATDNDPAAACWTAERVSGCCDWLSAELVRAGIRWVSEAAPGSDDSFPTPEGSDA